MGETREEAYRGNIREVCALWNSAGLMSLLDDVAEPVHGTELPILTTLLFNVSLLGFHRT